jgi:hypothetical protein
MAATKNIPWMPPTDTRISSLCLALTNHSALPRNVACEPERIEHRIERSRNELRTTYFPMQDAFATFQKNYKQSIPRKILERVGKAVICPLEPGEMEFQVGSYADVDITSSCKTNNRNRSQTLVCPLIVLSITIPDHKKFLVVVLFLPARRRMEMKTFSVPNGDTLRKHFHLQHPSGVFLCVDMDESSNLETTMQRKK